MTFWTIFGCIYLTVSCLIGMLSLTFIQMHPEEFDEYRSNNPAKRVETVASVMMLGPLFLILALVGRK